MTGSNAVPCEGRQLNPPARDGAVSRCVVCDSRYHWAKQCPHAYENINGGEDSVANVAVDSEETETKEESHVHLSLFMGLTENENQCNNKLGTLVKNCEGSALIDTGCSTTVCGENWLSSYIGLLSEYDRADIKDVVVTGKRASFTFGDGKTVSSLKRLLLPCYINGRRCTIETDVVESNIPLLMSKKAMKKGQMCLDFEKDVLVIAGDATKLTNATSGHYLLPLTI